jgi:hypothetical protein
MEALRVLVVEDDALIARLRAPQNRHEGNGADATNDARGAPRCGQSNTFQRVGAVHWRAVFDRLAGTRRAFCRCPRRPKGRSWPQNDPESGMSVYYDEK